MKNSGGIAALAALLLLACAFVAWEAYAHVTARHSVQQIAAAPSPAAAATTAPAPALTPTPKPVTYVPLAQASAAAAPATSGPGAPAPSAQPATPAPVQVSAQPQVTAAPAIAATLAPRVVPATPIAEAPNAPPRILAMTISDPVVHGGEIVSGTVETSSNVASVEARIAGYSSSLRKVGVGKFTMSYRVPNLPFFLHRTYQIQVIARNTRGDSVSSSVPITVR